MSKIIYLELIYQAIDPERSTIYRSSRNSILIRNLICTSLSYHSNVINIKSQSCYSSSCNIWLYSFITPKSTGQMPLSEKLQTKWKKTMGQSLLKYSKLTRFCFYIPLQLQQISFKDKFLPKSMHQIVPLSKHFHWVCCTVFAYREDNFWYNFLQIDCRRMTTTQKYTNKKRGCVGWFA